MEGNVKWSAQRYYIVLIYKAREKVYCTEKCIQAIDYKGYNETRACSDYGMFFNACDKANRQIKNRIWPHKHGGRGRLGERGKYSLFAFGMVLQNTFNAFVT